MNKHLTIGISAASIILMASLAHAQKSEGGGGTQGASQGAVGGGGSTPGASQGAAGSGGGSPAGASPARDTNAAPRNEATTPAAPSDAPKKSADDNRKGERKQPAKAAGDARKDNDKEARPTKDGDAPAKGNAKAASDRGKGMDKQDRSAVGGEPKSDRTAKGAEKGGGTVSLTGEQRTQVISGFAKHRSEARENINISVNVGVAVPRSARLHTSPRDILVIYPDYRRYRYFIVDDRVVIVDPVRFVIVDVIVLTA